MAVMTTGALCLQSPPMIQKLIWSTESTFAIPKEIKWLLLEGHSGFQL